MTILPKALLLMTIAALAGCSNSAAETATEVPRPIKYVAIGASESIGEGADRPAEEAWTVLVSRELPEGSSFVNLGVGGSTTRQAVQAQLPKALEANPDLVTVWLNVNDLISQVPVAQYEADLRALLVPLQKDGRRVFVANTPPLGQLPVLAQARNGSAAPFLPSADQIDGRVADYNAVISKVAEETGAVVVDLNGAVAAAAAERRYGELISADGFHPSTLGHRKAADAFIAAIKQP